MRKLNTLLMLIASTAITTVAADFVKDTDFSGEWSLDEGASKLGERSRQPKNMTVTQGRTTLMIKVERTGRNGETMDVTSTYTLSGEETTASVRGGSLKSTAVWSEGNSQLTISSTRTMSRNGNELKIESKQIWTLSKDGKTLTISGTNTNPRGENSFTAVYTKK